jgi:hypothetical protein
MMQFLLLFLKKTNCFSEMMTSVAVLVFACTLVELSAKRKLPETLQQLKRKGNNKLKPGEEVILRNIEKRRK